MSTLPHDLPVQTLEKISDLILMNHDSCVGFQAAAQVIEDRTLSFFFLRIAFHRSQFAEDFRRLVPINLEVNPNSWSGKVYPWWLDLYNRSNASDPYVLLIEVQKNEVIIRAYYEEVLEEIAQGPVRETLARHYLGIDSDYSQICELTEIARNARNSA